MANGDAGDSYGNGRNVNLRRFAESVLNDGMSKGRMLQIGNMSHFLGFGIARRNGFVRNEPIYIDDRVILKYVHHPKKLKALLFPRNI